VADSFTPNYNLLLQQQGGDSGVWGTGLNQGDFVVLDNILGATYSASITSSDVTLTTTQFQNGIFILNGTLTGNHNFILPYQTGTTAAAVGGKFVVINNTSGGYAVTVKTAAANATSGVALAPQGQVVNLYSDTVNVGYDNSGLPASIVGVSGNPTGQLAGTAASINNNVSVAYDYTNNAFYLCTTSGTAGSAVWSQPAVSLTRGFDMPANLSFTASLSANVLTLTAVAANTGTTPTLTNPIVFAFGDSTLGNGDPVTVNATSALSISTFTTGANLGASNGTPFRFWITVFNSGGLNLALINCSVATAIYPLNESVLASTVGMSATAASAGIFYTPNGVTLGASPFRVVGFLEYSAGLVTAGTYNNSPTLVRLFSPGTRKPGEAFGEKYSGVVTATTNISNTQTQTQISASITPTSTVNLVRASSNISFGGGSAGSVTFQISRGTSPTLIGTKQVVLNSSQGGAQVRALDAPASTSALTYYVYGVNSGASSSPVINDTGTSDLLLEEIMG
jgi:hypothetical protein